MQEGQPCGSSMFEATCRVVPAKDYVGYERPAPSVVCMLTWTRGSLDSSARSEGPRHTPRVEGDDDQNVNRHTEYDVEHRHEQNRLLQE